MATKTTITELRRFKAPPTEEDEEDVIFTFDFTIKKTGRKLNVTFTLTLNPNLADTSTPPPQSPPPSPPQPPVFTFENNTYNLNYTPDENPKYVIRGTINIVSLSAPNGQFDNQTKNFFFDNIEFGLQEDPLQRLEGLFALEVIE